jgi:hypothetical protein
MHARSHLIMMSAASGDTQCRMSARTTITTQCVVMCHSRHMPITRTMGLPLAVGVPGVRECDDRVGILLDRVDAHSAARALGCTQRRVHLPRHACTSRASHNEYRTSGPRPAPTTINTMSTCLSVLLLLVAAFALHAHVDTTHNTTHSIRVHIGCASEQCEPCCLLVLQRTHARTFTCDSPAAPAQRTTRTHLRVLDRIALERLVGLRL